MASLRKIAVVTSSRADFGLLRKLISLLSEQSTTELLLYVTGTHLLEEHGLTKNEISNQGFSITSEWPTSMRTRFSTEIAHSMAEVMQHACRSLEQDKPDIVVLLGDRYEIFAAAAATTLCKIPIAHIHGGETSEGAIDEVLRHSVTKMSYWHFTAAEAYQKRVIQMGEAPERVFMSGSPGIDSIKELAHKTRAEVLNELNLPADARYFLITYHPVTLSTANQTEMLENLLGSLAAYSDYYFVFTGVNADQEGDLLSDRIKDFAASTEKARHFSSLGQRLYLNAMKHCALVLGNSSSGIIEAPFLKVPTVNIGMRQRGRLMASSVLQAEDSIASISKAITQALSPEFQANLPSTISLYGDANASSFIFEKLKLLEIPKTVAKTFFDSYPPK